jgi:hypothetical protein
MDFVSVRLDRVADTGDNRPWAKSHPVLTNVFAVAPIVLGGVVLAPAPEADARSDRRPCVKRLWSDRA